MSIMPHLLTALLTILIIGLGGFGRSFAYIRMGPFYVTEWVLALSLLVLVVQKIRERDWSLPPGAWCLTLLFVWASFGFVRANIWDAEAIKNSVIVYYGLFYFVAYYAAASWSHVRYLLGAVLVATVVNFYPLVQSARQPELFENFRLMGGNIIFAVFVLIGMVAYADRLRAQSRLWKWGALLMALVCAAEIGVSFHRSEWLGAAVALVLLYILARTFQPKLSKYIGRWLGWGALVAPVAGIATLLAIGKSPQSLFEYILLKLQVLQEGNATWRIDAWRATWERFWESPWLGLPWDQPVLTKMLRGVPTDDPHNSFMALLCRVGIIGAGIFFIFLCRVVGVWWRTLSTTTDSNQRRLLLISVANLVFMMVFAFFNVVLEGPHHGLFFWLVLGLGSAVACLPISDAKSK